MMPGPRGRLAAALLAAGLALSPACAEVNVHDNPPTAPLRLTGTVRRIEIEGGCWVFEVPPDRRYELLPDHVPPGFLVDGRKATVRGRVLVDLTTICQVGPVLEVQAVE